MKKKVLCAVLGGIMAASMFPAAVKAEGGET